MNALEQAQSKLLYWAKYILEEEGHRYDRYDPEEDDPADAPPVWFEELRAAVDLVECEGGEAIE
jgi:hypothetical protein